MSSVPHHLRAPIGCLLDELVRGLQPELLAWVRRYGKGGATLVPQPAEIWSHPHTSVMRCADGGWVIDIPLWTTDAAPSDLTATIGVDRAGNVSLDDVHVL